MDVLMELWQAGPGVVPLALWCGCVYALYVGLGALWAPRRRAAAPLDGPSFGARAGQQAQLLRVPLHAGCEPTCPASMLPAAPKFAQAQAGPVVALPLYPPVGSASRALGAYGSRRAAPMQPRPLYAEAEEGAAAPAAAEAKPAASTLARGQEVEGTVVGVADFGVFVDVGVDVDGLLHVNKMSPDLLTKGEDGKDTINVAVGALVTATVATADKKLSLTQRVLGEDGNDKRSLDQFTVGDKVDGTVNGVVDFGIFVDVGAKVNGLVHISETMPESLGDSPTAVKVGDTMTVRVTGVDLDKSKLSLSQYLEPQAKPERSERKPKGKKARDDTVMAMVRDLEGTDTFIPGKVQSIVDYGAFVELGSGVTGLLHVSALQATRTENVGDVLTEGQDIEVRVDEVEESGKISLSMVPLEEAYDSDELEADVDVVGEEGADAGPKEPRDPDFDDYFADVEVADPGLDELMNERDDSKGEEKVDNFWGDTGAEPSWRRFVTDLGGQAAKDDAPTPRTFGVLETSDLPIIVDETPVAAPPPAPASLEQDAEM